MDFWRKLKTGLGKTSKNVSEGISAIFAKRALDEETLDAFEDLLIGTDMGAATAASLREKLRDRRSRQEVSTEEIKEWLAAEITEILKPVTGNLKLTRKPEVILAIGVNGVGKTTTIAKLSKLWLSENKKVSWAAGDTFRAAAVEQLQIWGQRLGVPVLTAKPNGDAAGLAYDALKKAIAENHDALCIDTAGRLQNKQPLMDELRKIVKVIRKIDSTAPHRVILTLDATTGLNAIEQVKAFTEITEVTDLIVTKLDGTAKGGVVVALAEKFAIPIMALGIGEAADDLRPFVAADFAKALVT